jgi:ATP-binding cassette subfamily C protein
MMKPIIRYFKHIYVILIPLFLSAYLNLRMALSLMNVIDSAIDGDWSAFWNHALWLMIFTLLLYIANLITHYATVNFTKSVVTKMKTDYVQAVFNKNIAEFQKDNIASYLSLVTNDFAIIETDYIDQVMIILSGCVRAITAIVIFVIVSPLVLLIGLLTLILSVVLSMIIEKPVQKHNKERSVLFAEYNSFIKEVLSALGIIKNNGLEDRIRTNFRDKSLAVQHKKYVIDKLMSFVFAGQNFIGGVVVIGIALFTVRLTIAGSVTFAGVIVVINNIDKLITPIINVSEAVPNDSINRSRSKTNIENRYPFTPSSKPSHFRMYHFPTMTCRFSRTSTSHSKKDKNTWSSVHRAAESRPCCVCCENI